MKKQIFKTTAYTALTVFLSSFLTLHAVAETSKTKTTEGAANKTAANQQAASDKEKEPVTAKKDTAKPTADSDKTTIAMERKIRTDKQQKIVHEAREALSEILQALVAIENKDTKTAQSSLKSATSNLATVIAKNPGVDLIPVAVDVDVTEYEGDAASVSKAINEAEKLLAGGQLQAARKILSVLASEVEVVTSSIPLNIFPNAVKEAEKLLNAGKSNEAEVVLNDALNTQVDVVEVMPLPVLRAEALLSEAALLEHTLDLSKDTSRADVLKFTDAAKEKLKLAELLGYGSKDDYQLLYTAIDEMKTTIATEKSAAAWDKIKTMLADLKGKLMPAKK